MRTPSSLFRGSFISAPASLASACYSSTCCDLPGAVLSFSGRATFLWSQRTNNRRDRSVRRATARQSLARWPVSRCVGMPEPLCDHGGMLETTAPEPALHSAELRTKRAAEEQCLGSASCDLLCVPTPVLPHARSLVFWSHWLMSLQPQSQRPEARPLAAPRRGRTRDCGPRSDENFPDTQACWEDDDEVAMVTR